MKTPAITLASSADVDRICDVMKKVYESMEDKALFVCDSPEFVRAHIEDEGFTVIACDNDTDEAAGYFIFRYPGIKEDNLGRDIGLSDEELERVVHMESAAVLPRYRGLSLQSKMLCYGEELIDKSKYKYFLATVSPDNPHSFQTFENNGYELAATKEKYGGLMRRIYLKTV
ncbi:MAG: N-acetyltransferase [Lachnospiraceae bacterium]|nr:N-acetyltransferase [Lachnospiraceae bacterium]